MPPSPEPEQSTVGAPLSAGDVVIPREDAALVAAVFTFGTWLCSFPETDEDQRTAIQAVLAEWAKLPHLTPGFHGSIEWSVYDRQLRPLLVRRWGARLDPDEGVVFVYTYADDDILNHEHYHAWRRAPMARDRARDLREWLAEFAARPAIRAAGTASEVDVTATWSDEGERRA